MVQFNELEIRGTVDVEKASTDEEAKRLFEEKLKEEGMEADDNLELDEIVVEDSDEDKYYIRVAYKMRNEDANTGKAE